MIAAKADAEKEHVAKETTVNVEESTSQHTVDKEESDVEGGRSDE